MKKINLYFIASLGIGALSFPFGATAQLHQSTVNSQNSYHSSVIDDEDDEDDEDEDEDEDDEYDEDEDDEYDEDDEDEVEKNQYDILRRDQIDSTSTLAIPFDDSEVEDELEVNEALKRRAFKVPEPPQPHHSK